MENEEKLQKLQQEIAQTKSLKKFSNFVKENTLSDEALNIIVQNENVDFLREYLKYQELTTSQITKILSQNGVNVIMKELVRLVKKFNERQQLLIVNKRNALLTEAYLFPDGFFDIKRRFYDAVEYRYIEIMAQTNKLVGLEAFKAYVDNNYGRMIRSDVILLLIKYPDSYATRYILHRGKIRKEFEVLFIENASVDLIKYYLEEKQFSTDKGQLALIQKSMELAQIHQSRYGFYPRVHEIFFKKKHY